MAVEKYKLASITTLATTALNSMTNNALVVCTDYDNTQGAAGDGYIFCEVEYVWTQASAPTAGRAFSLWLLGAPDGTNYEDGSTSITPARAPDFSFPVRAVTTAQRVTRRGWLPPALLRPLLKNDNTGQTTAASGNTLKIRPVTIESVG